MSVGQTNVPSMSPANDPEIAAVLTCWKDIAQYVGKGVGTVQRWEKEMGFPVRGTRPGEKDTVLAITGEIDAWIQAQQFPEGQLDSLESERPTLFRILKELRSKNKEL